MGKESGIQKIRYPRSEARLILGNKVVLLGAGLSLTAAFFIANGVWELAHQEYQPAISEFESGVYFLFWGLEALAIAEFGKGTIEAYRRTIDAYRLFGKAPTKYEGRYAGWYCQRSAFKKAMKDIKSGKADVVPKTIKESLVVNS